MQSHKYDHFFKLLILGESSVGKTCILLRYTDDHFNINHLATIGIDFNIKIVSLEDKFIKLQIWDTAGQDRFKTITKTYFKGAQGILLVYDITNEDSFENIRNWVKQIEQNATKNVCKILIGNKHDRDDRKVTYEQGEELAKEYNMHFLETSAKTNYNINEAFVNITKEILNSDIKTMSNNKTLKINKKEEKVESGTKCCK
jgi:small GTP-binding protein